MIRLSANYSGDTWDGLIVVVRTRTHRQHKIAVEKLMKCEAQGITMVSLVFLLVIWSGTSASQSRPWCPVFRYNMGVFVGIDQGRCGVEELYPCWSNESGLGTASFVTLAYLRISGYRIHPRQSFGVVYQMPFDQLRCRNFNLWGSWDLASGP